MTSATGLTITPTENLVLEGIPPIPASLVETVGRYTEFRSARQGELASYQAGNVNFYPLRRHHTGALSQVSLFESLFR